MSTAKRKKRTVKRRKNPKWTTKQLASLQKNYSNNALTQKQLEGKIGRSWDSIKRKASSLELKRKKTLRIKKGQRFGSWVVTGKKPKKLSYLVCQCDCGITKEVAKSTLAHGKSTQCNTCAKQKLSLAFRKRTTVLCSSCKKKLERTAYLFKRNQEHFCDKICRKNFFRNKWIANPPQWKKLRRLRRTPAYKNWSRVVKQAGDNTCLRCGSKDKRLHSHHLLSFALYPDERFDVTNGICLCEDCHLEFHKLYKNFTRDDAFHYSGHYIKIVFPGKPKTKSNNYRFGKGRFFVPKDIKEHEAKLKEKAIQAMGSFPPFTEPVILKVTFFLPDRRRRDIDNLMKTVADALNKVVYDDDSLICQMHISKELDRDNPRTEIEVGIIKASIANL